MSGEFSSCHVMLYRGYDAEKTLQSGDLLRKFVFVTAAVDCQCHRRQSYLQRTGKQLPALSHMVGR